MTKTLAEKRKGHKGNIESSASSSIENTPPNRKRSRPSEEGRSSRSRSRSSKKIRKNGRSDASSSSLSFSLTPNAIESIVSGMDILGRRDDSLENPPKKSTKKMEEIATSNGTAINNKIPRTELILRLRIDLPPPVSEPFVTDAQKPNNLHHEEQAALFGTLGDGKSSIRVMVLNPDGIWSKRLIPKTTASDKAENQGTTRRRDCDWIVKVHGYASTEKFWHLKYRIFPVICLTSISILQTCDHETKSLKTKSSSSLSALGKPLFSNSVGGNIDSFFTANRSCKAQAGTIGTFLRERGPFLTNEELAGSSRILDHRFETPTTTTSLENENDCDSATSCLSLTQLSRNQNFKKVHECLSRHSAMLTLQQSSLSPSSSSNSSSTNGGHDANASSSPSSTTAVDDSSSSPQPQSPLKSKRPTQHAWELYEGALREFKTSQMDRQKASLGTNAGRESAERAEMVVERHNSALELALKEEGPLSIELLEKWHKELLRGLHPEAGKIRTRKVRCGHTIFCPPKRIRKELELYCAGLKSLELRLDMANNALHAVLFAGVAMFGIVDIHPFIDGNGRLSRIVANYALKQLPFPINLFATPAQRNEYVVAIERTRHLLSINCAYGDVSRDDLIQVLKTTGVFGSLVQLLIDRVARAATAFTAIWEEKSGLAAEAAEAKAARRVRERASRGTCMICLDEKPNIATLCCGNAIHLNCCAEWLSGNNKCPICRHEMPSISRRVVRALEEPEERWEEDDNADLSEFIEGRHPAVFSREYHNFVDRFWNEIRNSRSRINRSTRLPSDALVRFRRYESDESDFDEEFERDTTTTSEVDEDRDEPPSVIANGQNNIEGNGEEAMMENSDNNSSRFEEQDVGRDDRTASFAERLRHSDNSDSTTTTSDEDEENDTTTMDHSEESSREPRRRLLSTCCAAAACRNRPAVDCVNSLCGRCCVLIGNYHCPRHNS